MRKRMNECERERERESERRREKERKGRECLATRFTRTCRSTVPFMTFACIIHSHLYRHNARPIS